MTNLIHLPITEEGFDVLLVNAIQRPASVKDLTDEQLLILVQVVETVATQPGGARIAEAVDGWREFVAAVEREFEAR